MRSREITRLLEQASAGDESAAAQLFDSVYAELKQMAGAKMANEPLGHTLQTTDLVNEAYLRLFDSPRDPQFENRAHFFGAAAEAMRRILVDRARRVRALKHGGAMQRVDLEPSEVIDGAADQRAADQIEAVSEALETLEAEDPRAALVVKLRYFVGLSLDETAQALQVSASTVSADWTVSRAWLQQRLKSRTAGGDGE